MDLKKSLKTLWDYISSIIFLKSMFKLAIVVLVIILLTSLYLRIYTRHGKEYLTPELRGYTFSQVYKMVKNKGFNLKVIDSIENTIDNSLLPGTIVDQSPPANFNIKKGRTIFITIISYNVKKVALPELPGYVSITQAENELRPLGIKIGKIIFLPSSKDDGLVYAMLYKGDTVQPGFRIPKGSTIDLVVLRITDSLLYKDTISQHEQNDFFKEIYLE